jgi:hypothetical protein
VAPRSLWDNGYIPPVPSIQVWTHWHKYIWFCCVLCRCIIARGPIAAHCWGSEFLINGVMQPVSGQQLNKHVPAAASMHARAEEEHFLCGSCYEVMTRSVGAMSQLCRVEEESNTSTIALRVTGCGRERNPLPAVITGPPCSWGI